MNYWLILLPLLSACTGLIIVWTLAHYAFRPFNKQHFLGFNLQEAFPAMQQQLAINAGVFIAREFKNNSFLKDKFANPKNFERLRPIIESQIDDFLRNRLKVEMPMVGMFIGEKTIDQLKPIFIKEIDNMFPLIMNKYAEDITADINIDEMISDRITKISPEVIELYLKPIIRRGITKAYVLAIAIGFCMGLLQLLVISLA